MCMFSVLFSVMLILFCFQAHQNVGGLLLSARGIYSDYLAENTKLATLFVACENLILSKLCWMFVKMFTRASLSSLLNASHAIYIRRSLKRREKKSSNSNDGRKIRGDKWTRVYEKLRWLECICFSMRQQKWREIDKIFRPIDSVNQVRRTLRAYFYAFLSLFVAHFFFIFGGWEECRKHERTLTNKKHTFMPAGAKFYLLFFSFKVVSLFFMPRFFSEVKLHFVLCTPSER